jgi:hypothetical protein
MKAKLLKRLRNTGRNVIDVLSITTTSSAFSGKTITGMSYSYTGDEYRGLFSFGNTEQEVKEKACNIWLSQNIKRLRMKYKKYTRKYHLR